MLVLTRHMDDCVVLIGADGRELGRVMVVLVKGDKVRLGFEFACDVQIHRPESAEGATAIERARQAEQSAARNRDAS
jgi:sRNA-binding carbon storage regulator CsrA